MLGVRGGSDVDSAAVIALMKSLPPRARPFRVRRQYLMNALEIMEMEPLQLSQEGNELLKDDRPQGLYFS